MRWPRAARRLRRPQRPGGQRLHLDRRARGPALQGLLRAVHGRAPAPRSRTRAPRSSRPSCRSASRAGNPPDIAFIPQPGLLKTLVTDTGEVVEAPSDGLRQRRRVLRRGLEGLRHRRRHVLRPAADCQREVVRLVLPDDVRGERLGRSPTTWDDMIALSDTIADTGIKPWCVGIESGEATGWPATDWLEDVLLRTAGPDVYDQWVNHEIPFNDPAVAEALDERRRHPQERRLRQRRHRRRQVDRHHGRSRRAACPILDGECAMHRQASFYAANWPEGTDVAEDGDVFAFYLPTDRRGVRSPGPRRWRVRDRVLRRPRGAGAPDLPVRSTCGSTRRPRPHRTVAS